MLIRLRIARTNVSHMIGCWLLAAGGPAQGPGPTPRPAPQRIDLLNLQWRATPLPPISVLEVNLVIVALEIHSC